MVIDAIQKGIWMSLVLLKCVREGNVIDKGVWLFTLDKDRRGEHRMSRNDEGSLANHSCDLTNDSIKV